VGSAVEGGLVRGGWMRGSGLVGDGASQGCCAHGRVGERVRASDRAAHSARPFAPNRRCRSAQRRSRHSSSVST